jgi:hypothetical protein
MSWYQSELVNGLWVLDNEDASLCMEVCNATPYQAWYMAQDPAADPKFVIIVWSIISPSGKLIDTGVVSGSNSKETFMRCSAEVVEAYKEWSSNE